MPKGSNYANGVYADVVVVSRCACDVPRPYTDDEGDLACDKCGRLLVDPPARDESTRPAPARHGRRRP